MWRCVLVGSVLLGAVSCGGGKTDVRSVSGEIAFTGTTAYFFTSRGAIAPPDAGATPVNVLVLEVHESAEGCGPWPGVVPPDHAILSVTVDRPQSISIRPDSYPIANTPGFDGAWVTYFHENPSGDLMLSGVSGVFDLKALSDTAAAGSLDVTLQDGTRMEGDFSAGPCP